MKLECRRKWQVLPYKLYNAMHNNSVRLMYCPDAFVNAYNMYCVFCTDALVNAYNMYCAFCPDALVNAYNMYCAFCPDALVNAYTKASVARSLPAGPRGVQTAAYLESCECARASLLRRVYVRSSRVSLFSQIRLPSFNLTWEAQHTVRSWVVLPESHTTKAWHIIIATRAST